MGHLSMARIAQDSEVEAYMSFAIPSSPNSAILKNSWNHLVSLWTLAPVAGYTQLRPRSTIPRMMVWSWRLNHFLMSSQTCSIAFRLTTSPTSDCVIFAPAIGPVLQRYG